MEGRDHPEEIGSSVLARDRSGGDINIAPALSPDGRLVAFLSERDIFNINLFVADAETGEIVSRLRSIGGDPHFDALRFINSAGSWSPDGRRFALLTFVEAGTESSIWNVSSQRLARRITVQD